MTKTELQVVQQAVIGILRKFGMQEMGNRLSAFAMDGLMLSIDNLFEEKLAVEKEEVPNG